MSSAAFDSSALFATAHGTVDWVSEETLRVTLDDRNWTFGVAEFHELREAIDPLAAQVYRCNCDCRWQVRMDGQNTFVLDTDEVLHLHSLLDGAAAMLELDTLLADASIGRPSDA